MRLGSGPRRSVALWALALAQFVVSGASAAPGAMDAANGRAATEFGASQRGVAIGITSRSVPAAGGPHVLVYVTTKNTGGVAVTLAPISDEHLEVTDSTGKQITTSGTCPDDRSTPPPLEITFRPGDARVELNALDFTCYAVKPGRDYSVTVVARAAFVDDPAGAQAVDLRSNTIEVGLPDALSITSCRVPSRDARVLKPVEPDYPLTARAQGLTGRVVVAVILDDQGSVEDAFVYRSSGAKSLDEASLTAAKRSQFAPEIKNCVPVAGVYLFTAEFAYR